MSAIARVLPAITTLTLLSMAGCGGNDAPPTSPTPSPTLVVATAYILPDAVSRGDWAFGDEPVVIHRGERLRWVNADTLAHVIVADSPDATDFRGTEELPPAGEQSFIMNKLGMTGIHCALHPNMTGILVVREPESQTNPVQTLEAQSPTAHARAASTTGRSRPSPSSRRRNRSRSCSRSLAESAATHARAGEPAWRGTATSISGLEFETIDTQSFLRVSAPAAARRHRSGSTGCPAPTRTG